MEVNMAAAAEVARQLRLRDMGGIVIIDFIDLHKAENRQKLLDTMTQLMARDRAKHTILPLTKFGLMQITRQRVRPEAIAEATEVCPYCNGTGTVSPTIMIDDQLENKVSYYAQDKGLKYLELHVSPYIAGYLSQGFLSIRRRWQWRYKCRIKLFVDQSVGIAETKFYDRKGREIA